ncbi:MAG TPA: MgtC/SapB family protein [Gemmatimonadales bacterium]|nr:MgtC/SapB family protein [Gemmatimonadales bacterium]
MTDAAGFQADAALRLAVAGLIGLAIGVEREWSGHASGPRARFAGVRTFFLLGLLSGIAGLLAARDRTLLAAVLLAGPALLAVAAYVVASIQTGDRDGTTEAAALLVLATGGLSGLGEESIAAAVAALAAVALAEKSRVRELITRIGETELRAALQFAVLAVLVLPLIPPGPFGPGGAIRPRELWSVVLIFSGINFLGYLARRAVGAERGYGIAGLLGGLVSSTAVTLGFSRQSRVEPEHARGLALGVVAACTVLFARVFIVTAVLSASTARALGPYLIAPAVIGGAIVGYAAWRQPAWAAQTAAMERNPLRLGAAVRMTLAFALVLLVIPLVDRLWGAGGVLGSAAVLGLTDMDALTYSMARLGVESGDSALAARAIGVGLAANTIAKLGLAVALGAAPFRRRAAPALSALAIGILAALVFLR